jgi:hypothetical protein
MPEVVTRMKVDGTITISVDLTMKVIHLTVGTIEEPIGQRVVTMGLNAACTVERQFIHAMKILREITPSPTID